MRFDILTLFEGFFTAPLGESIIGRALRSGLFEVRTHDIRAFASDRHRTTDDAPYGGGPGMVMKAGPVVKALESLGVGLDDEVGAGRRGGTRVVLTTPQGVPFTDTKARELARLERVVIICGRYEGVDERIRAYADMELSIGDYVLTGGEPAALVIIDAVARFIPGVLGDETSSESDSFSSGLLEYPHYTRPEVFRGIRVPGVLLSGNHAEIERWRRSESLRRTYERRPELLERAELAGELSDEDAAVIKELKGGTGGKS